MQVLPPPPASRGPDILTNGVILESILPELPHVSDILSLQLVSRQLYLLVLPLHPLYAREISFAHLPEVKNKDVITVLHRCLRPGPSTQRRLLADGRTVTVGDGIGKAYVGPWRFLRSITLTGTAITGRSVKLLIAASSGGKIPGISELLRERQAVHSNGDLDLDIDHGVTNGFFAKEFGSISAGAYRLLADQSLRLDKLCITDCPQVDITDINNFLKKILIAVTAPKRRELRLRASQQAVAAVAQQNGPPNFNPAQAAGNAQIGALIAAQAQQLQQAPTLSEDLTSIPYPLPSTVEELAEFGLPCLSLRRLEVANVGGLYVDPPERFRGKKEWNYSKDCPFGRNIGSLNSIAGCLGLDVDVLFCQGAGCATSSDNGRWRHSNHYGFDADDFDSFDGIIPDLANPREHNPQAPSQAGEPSASSNNIRGNARRSYRQPLPRLPGERILISEDGRVFRIPRHALPNTFNQPQNLQATLNQFQQANQQLQQGNQQINQQFQQNTLNFMNNIYPPNHNVLLNGFPAIGAGAGAGAGAGVGVGAGAGAGAGLGAGGGGGGNVVAAAAAATFGTGPFPPPASWVAGGGVGGGGINGWASNLFLQDPAQYGLGALHQPQHPDNQTYTAAPDQTLIQMNTQTYPGTGTNSSSSTSVAVQPPNTITPAVTVTPHAHDHQNIEFGPALPPGLEQPTNTGATINPYLNIDATNSSQGPNVENTHNPSQQDDMYNFLSDEQWQGLLGAPAADTNGVQTPPYGQSVWNGGTPQSISTPGSSSSSAAGPSIVPPNPTLNSLTAQPTPMLAPPPAPALPPAPPPPPASIPVQTQIQTATPGAGQTGNHTHQNQGLVQMIQPYLPAVVGAGIGNPHPHLVGGFAPVLPHLPRRRNNSPGGSRGGTSQTGARPGRRIAMLDGPRGLCERCEREVWLCDSCNRYWVVTCGGCAAKL